MNRKLIRQKLSEVQERGEGKGQSGGATTSRELSSFGDPMGGRRKQIPPEQTNAENFYYIKQMTSRSAVTVVMEDGEKIRGAIEWYDRDCIKINRTNGPNLLVMKRYIKFIYKDKERS